MKLSDSKYIQRSIQRAQVQPKESLHADDYGLLRGVFDKTHREARMMFPEAEEQYEVVSFTDPRNGLRRFGYLVDSTPEGNGRVEIGDGQYAEVPPTELRRLGKKDDARSIKAQLRAAIGQVSTETNGVRADMHERMEPMLIDAQQRIELLSVGYSTTVGVPTVHEVNSYMSRFHPTAQVVDVDESLPGVLGVATIRQAEHEVEAEMEGAAGGDVLETFDPEEEDEDREADIAKTALLHRLAAIEPEDLELAQALVASGDKAKIAEVIKAYLTSGGADSLAKLMVDQPKTAIPQEQLVALGLQLMKRKDSSFFGRVFGKDYQGLKRSLAPLVTQQKAQSAADAQQLQTQKNVAANVARVALPVIDKAKKKVERALKNPSALRPLTTSQTTDLQNEIKDYEEMRKAFEALAQDPNALNPQQLGYVARVVPVLKSNYRLDTVEPNWSKFLPKNVLDAIANPPKTASRRASWMNERTAASELPRAKTPSPMQSYTDVSKHAMPGAAADIAKHMTVQFTGRQGSYVCATVRWEKLQGLNEAQLTQSVRTFVQAKANGHVGNPFGGIGRVHVLSIDPQKRVAYVKFATLEPGHVPTTVVEHGD